MGEDCIQPDRARKYYLVIPYPPHVQFLLHRRRGSEKESSDKSALREAPHGRIRGRRFHALFQPPVQVHSDQAQHGQLVIMGIQVILSKWIRTPTLRGVNFAQLVNTFERSILDQVLQKTNGNRTFAADLLRLKRTTLVSKLRVMELSA